MVGRKQNLTPSQVWNPNSQKIHKSQQLLTSSVTTWLSVRKSVRKESNRPQSLIHNLNNRKTRRFGGNNAQNWELKMRKNFERSQGFIQCSKGPILFFLPYKNLSAQDIGYRFLYMGIAVNWSTPNIFETYKLLNLFSALKYRSVQYCSDNPCL